MAPDSPPSVAPKAGPDRYRLQQWLSFITSELHKVVFIPLLDARSNEGAKAYAREKAEPRFAYLNSHLEGRDYLLDNFTVADAYLITVLNWNRATNFDLGRWPAVRDYAASCENPSGGFRGGLWDDRPDVEYTFYGLGTLALAALRLD